MAIFKIAFRNMKLQKKQSLFIGIALFWATFLILLCSAILNGATKQIMNTYLNLKAGEVIVAWKDVMEESSMSPQKFLYMGSATINRDYNLDNMKSIALVEEYLTEHHEQVEAYFYNLRYDGTIVTKDTEDTAFTLYSLNQPNVDWILQKKAIKVEQGELLSEKGVCISRAKAESLGLDLGDEITIKVTDLNNIEKSIRVEITGIYQNKADYENYYVFMPEALVYRLCSYKRNEYDIARIYLKEDKNIPAFTKGLQEVLKTQGDVLRAEEYTKASLFLTQFNELLKCFYDIFLGFFVLIIAIGLSATMRMKLFQRMEEFGTLRAIGYSRRKCYGVIFFEIFLVALIGNALSVIFISIAFFVFGSKGIYIGTGVMTYMLGDTYLYPILKVSDVCITVIVTLVFSLLATINPSQKILYQKITDIMVKRQRKVYPMRIRIRQLQRYIIRKVKRPAIKYK